MKTKYLISFIIISAIAIIGSVGLFNKVALAQETAGAANLQYPVKELGNCQDAASCKTYCDKSDNNTACLNFAEKNNLMSKDEVNTAKNFVASGSKGPGGCAGKDACETYCDDINNINDCVSFAEKNNLMSAKDLAEAKQVQAAIARGVKPPPCKNKKECDSYCEDPNNMEKCVAFGVEAGFIQGKELEDSQKMLAALKRGVKPPPCKGKEACDQYCGEPNNMEVCTNFAIEAGFMNEQEKADSQKMLAAIKQGIKPPACKGKEECNTYCSQDAHFEECTSFAEAAGFMSKEDAVMVRKTGGKGPGGCKNKDECDTFCNNPDNQETCFQFGKENGMIPEADLKRMEEGQQKMKDSFSSIPPEVLDCISSSLGADVVEKMKTGSVIGRQSGDSINQCFQKFGTQERRPGQNQQGQDQPGQSNQQNQQGQGGTQGQGQSGSQDQGGSNARGMMSAGGQGELGGCKTPEECKNFQPGSGTVNPGGQQMPQQAGPGGCKGPEECQKYCTSNPEECKNFQPSQPNQPGQLNQPGQPRQQGQMRTQQQPPTGNQQPPTQQNMPPQGQQPQQPQQGMTNPPEGMMPPANQQPPTGNTPPPPTQTPPPTENTTPPPSGSINPESLSGSIMRVFTQTLQK